MWWRTDDDEGVTAISRKLLVYSADSDRDNRMLNAQREGSQWQCSGRVRARAPGALLYLKYRHSIITM